MASPFFLEPRLKPLQATFVTRSEEQQECLVDTEIAQKTWALDRFNASKLRRHHSWSGFVPYGLSCLEPPEFAKSSKKRRAARATSGDRNASSPRQKEDPETHEDGAAAAASWPDTDDEIQFVCSSPCTARPQRATTIANIFGPSSFGVDADREEAEDRFGVVAADAAAARRRAFSGSDYGYEDDEEHTSGDFAEDDQIITTLMVRNLPPGMSQQGFMQELDGAGFADMYDFVYLPTCFKSRDGKGYAFVNFSSVGVAGALIGAWHGSRRFISEAGGVPLNLSPAVVQGLDANLKKWGRMSRVRDPMLRPFTRRTDASASPCSSPKSSRGSAAIGCLIGSAIGSKAEALSSDRDSRASPVASTLRRGTVPAPEALAALPPPQGPPTAPVGTQLPIGGRGGALGAVGAVGAVGAGGCGCPQLSSIHSVPFFRDAALAPPPPAPPAGTVAAAAVAAVAAAANSAPMAGGGQGRCSAASSVVGSPTTAMTPCLDLSAALSIAGSPIRSPIGSDPRMELDQIQASDVTTLMIRNIPKEVTQKQFIQAMEQSGFTDLFDFVYMPCCFSARESKGYVFVNLTSPSIATAFVGAWHGSRRFGVGEDGLPLSITAATVQGLEANAAQWAGPRMNRIRNPDLRPFVRTKSGLPGTLSTTMEMLSPTRSSLAPSSPSATLSATLDGSLEGSSLGETRGGGSAIFATSHVEAACRISFGLMQSMPSYERAAGATMAMHSLGAAPPATGAAAGVGGEAQQNVGRREWRCH